MQVPFDRIHVIAPAGLNASVYEKYLATLRTVPFQRVIGVHGHFATHTVLPRHIGMSKKTTPCDSGGCGIAETEVSLASDLMNSVFRAQLVLKYPNPFAGRTSSDIRSALQLWSRAIAAVVPADFDIVMCAPERATTMTSLWQNELVSSDAYVMSSKGAEKLLLLHRFPTSHRYQATTLTTPQLLVYSLDLDHDLHLPPPGPGGSQRSQ